MTTDNRITEFIDTGLIERFRVPPSATNTNAAITAIQTQLDEVAFALALTFHFGGLTWRGVRQYRTLSLFWRWIRHEAQRWRIRFRGGLDR